MEIKKVTNNGTLNVTISGRVDTTTAPALEQELKASYGDCNALVIDFANVEYISSAGLRVLLSAQKVMCKKDGMKLINVGADIMEIFEVTGFSDILTIE
ncbi:STAS domain-containing protein [uncultured Ruminococcus sp.]|uniref:STAS domain-containing protein n=1 Tax=uncultured Ruminococcus sp. TaxID=165186 RepID=UPI000ED66F3A|nr:STAS domain-containing protein [uncultured Ruminococcus sp.]HCJ40822.1 anti-sigma factor antagonist [Ruminococcus sp.]